MRPARPKINKYYCRIVITAKINDNLLSFKKLLLDLLLV